MNPRSRSMRTTGVAALMLLPMCIALPTHAEPAGRTATERLERTGWTLITGSDDTLVYMKDQEGSVSAMRRVWTAYDSERERDQDGRAFARSRASGNSTARGAPLGS